MTKSPWLKLPGSNIFLFHGKWGIDSKMLRSSLRICFKSFAPPSFWCVGKSGLKTLQGFRSLTHAGTFSSWRCSFPWMFIQRILFHFRSWSKSGILNMAWWRHWVNHTPFSVSTLTGMCMMRTVRSLRSHIRLTTSWAARYPVTLQCDWQHYHVLAAVAHLGEDLRGHYRCLLRCDTGNAEKPFVSWLTDDNTEMTMIRSIPDWFLANTTMAWLSKAVETDFFAAWPSSDGSSQPEPSSSMSTLLALFA